MLLSKNSTCKSSPSTRCPMAAAASYVSDHNISDIARKIGVGEKILINKLNDNCDSHHLNLQQAVAIGDVTNDHRVLNAWAYSLGKTIIDLPDVGLSEEEFADQVLKVGEASGGYCKAIRLAREDGIIEQSEFNDIQSKALEAIVSILHVTAELEQMVRPGPSTNPPNSPAKTNLKVAS
ncbi:phage regulatory CII family protein [Pseudoalteromonas sp. NCIMB_1079]|uniref:phage regulatory CII family protein n=1 Tax=Pseudoalteromonas sp. NCIMB 1079 TaxID=3142847 RepID=UPI00339CBEB2